MSIPDSKSAVAAADGMNASGEEPKPEFQLQIAADYLTAYLRVKPAYPGQKVTPEQIIDYLGQNGVVFGICEEEIHTFCEQQRFYSELICAKGVAPVDGVDGWIDFKFDTETGLKPKDRGDGTVDFRDLGLVKNISKGEVLCQVIPPEEGKDGTDVYNNVIRFHPGRFPALPGGLNTVVSEDRLSLIAGVDGCIEYVNSNINVNDVFIVRGNVDGSSGNISAVGSIIIQGDVREGFSVKSDKDISIRGMAEGAEIEAKGNISISNGMNGMRRGTLKAGGNIVGKYFENAGLTANGDIYADVLLNCDATAGGSIILKGSKASLIGGSYQVGKKIYAKNIGTSSNAGTRIAIQSQALTALLSVGEETGSMNELNNKLAEAEKAFSEYQEKFSDLTRQISESELKNTPKGNLMVKSAILKKSQLAGTVDEIKKQIDRLKEKTDSLMDFNITGVGIVYPGTKITIGPFTMNVQVENSNMKFYADQEHVTFGPVLPSDFV